MKQKKAIRILFTLIIFSILYYVASFKFDLNPSYKIGQELDSFNNISVYYNGGVGNTNGRNTSGGYNFGLKYQCVEFVKRYYYKHLNHKMPNTYGNAKDFYNESIKDDKLNKARGLSQFVNGSHSKPKVNDLIVYSSTIFNKYGHVSIVSQVTNNQIEIIQQNTGSFGSTRETYNLEYKNKKWFIKNRQILGWLRK